MTSFKKIIYPALLALLAFSSCKKYPDGPGFSLRPKKWRLSGTWQVEQLLVNGQDMTSAYFPNRTFFESYEGNGYYEYDNQNGFSVDTASGSWKWVSKREQIMHTVSPFGNDALLITILKLENKSFWYTFTSGSQTYELHMQQD
jgi:hypothetical protein